MQIHVYIKTNLVNQIVIPTQQSSPTTMQAIIHITCRRFITAAAVLV